MTRSHRSDHLGRPGRHSGEAGFTLAELLVSLAVSLFLILSVLTMFEANARISRVQSDVADMQQNQRIAQFDMIRHAQMAGRGGLPMGGIPTGLAVAVRNNVGIDEHISLVDDDTPEVLDATDVLTVRGVFSSPIYQINFANPANFVLNGPAGAPTDGTLMVSNVSTTGIPMDLKPLADAIAEDRPEALILVSPLNDQTYAVVELDPSNSVVDDPDNPTQINLAFVVEGGTYTDEYAALSPGGAYPPGLNNAAYLGILEEYRFYVREIRAGGELIPTLMRARTYPGTEAPYAGSAANWTVEIAENVFDLQVAYGIDTDGDGVVLNGSLDPDGDPANDEWLFNHPNDQVNNPAWATGAPFYLRLTNLVRTDRPDRRHLAPVMLSIEDHDYGTSFLNQEEERAYRRRTLVTTVDLRNL